jgi:hypothetical protein
VASKVLFWASVECVQAVRRARRRANATEWLVQGFSAARHLGSGLLCRLPTSGYPSLGFAVQLFDGLPHLPLFPGDSEIGYGNAGIDSTLVDLSRVGCLPTYAG